jgi:imidazolonepropionase-like amidohydrolase
MELELMVKAGLTPMDAIVSATGDAARCMKNTTGLGTLKAGSPADFVIYRDDPTKDIRATRTLESVWVGGARLP